MAGDGLRADDGIGGGGDGTVLPDLRGSVYYGLNPAAAVLWRLLSAGATQRS